MFLPFATFRTQAAFNFLWPASSLIGILGFVIAYRALRRLDDGISGGESAIWGLFGTRLRASIVFTFVCAFFMPLVNLVIFLWMFFKMKGAVNRVEEHRKREQELRARRNRVMGPGGQF